VLAAAGAGAAAGGALENSTTEGLPEDEIFVYEDALRQGRSVVIAIADDAVAAETYKEAIRAEGAETIDAARNQWWIGLRSAEREHYEDYGKDSGESERYFRLGFEAALHARSRCKEFDQVSAEMARNIEELQSEHPGVDLEEAYRRGYQRGREYYQQLCNESKAA
jgi:cell division protein FtsI/penicillin-binding protein 2